MARRLPKVDARQYLWEELRGIRAILEFTEGRALPGNSEVELTHTAEVQRLSSFGGPVNLWSGYSTYLRWVQEAFQFSPDKILVCAATGSFVGTDHSDSSATRFYGLTRIRRG